MFLVDNIFILLQETARDALIAEEQARTAQEASLNAEKQQESRNFFRDQPIFDDNFEGNNFRRNLVVTPSAEEDKITSLEAAFSYSRLFLFV